MVHTWWDSMYEPGLGWWIRRYEKRSNLWPRVVEYYDRLTTEERDQVLDAELDQVLARLREDGGPELA